MSLSLLNTLWRHLRRQSEYVLLLDNVHLQASDVAKLKDGARMVLYCVLRPDQYG